MAKGKFKSKGVYAPVVGFSEQDYSQLQTLDGEQWKTVPLFGGIYEASNYGRLRSKERNEDYFVDGVLITRHRKMKLLRCVNDSHGYIRVSLRYKNKIYPLFVHRIVALTWLGESDLQIDHINGNKIDNRVCNLEYVTALENIRRAIKNGLLDPFKNHAKGINKNHRSKPKFNKEQIDEIRRLYSPHRFTRKMLAAKYNCGETVIRDVIKRRNAYKDK